MTPQHVTRWQSLRAAAEPTASTDSQRTPTPPTSAKPQSLGYFMLLLAALLIFFELLAANHHLMIRREVPR
jgi:hypothetical protein